MTTIEEIMDRSKVLVAAAGAVVVGVSLSLRREREIARAAARLEDLRVKYGERDALRDAMGGPELDAGTLRLVKELAA
jgi:hypothetical protein